MLCQLSYSRCHESIALDKYSSHDTQPHTPGIGKAMAGVMRMVTDIERNRSRSELSPKALGA